MRKKANAARQNLRPKIIEGDTGTLAPMPELGGLTSDSAFKHMNPVMEEHYREMSESALAQRENDFRKLVAAAPISVEAADNWLYRYCDSYERGQGLRRCQQYMNPLEFISLAGRHWSGIDNVWQHSWLICLLRKHGQRGIKAFMSPTELRVWSNCPRVIKVWRGCYPENRSGVSFTFNREIAKTFPTLNRYWRSDQAPIIVEALVNRSDCAIKLDRNEDEVVVLRRRVTHVFPLLASFPAPKPTR